MPLIPNWAPSIHPLLVHFPITLLITAFTVDLIGAWRPVSAPVRDSASWLYCGGALMALAAYFSGLGGASTLLVSFDEDIALTAHFTWAERTTWFFVFFASFRLSMSYIWHSTSRWLRVASLLISLTGVGMLLATAEHGGRLVFRYGVGVSPVPTSGHLWTVPGQPPRWFIAEKHAMTTKRPPHRAGPCATLPGPAAQPTKPNEQSPMSRLYFCVLVATIMLSLDAPSTAQEWPRFRGPDGAGITATPDDPSLPDTWSRSENVAWRTEIPGVGWGSQAER